MYDVSYLDNGQWIHATLSKKDFAFFRKEIRYICDSGEWVAIRRK